MDPCLKKMLNQTVYIAPPTSKKPGGGIGVTLPASAVKAYVQLVNRRVQTGEGSQTVTVNVVWTEDRITLDSQIWLPGTDPTVITGARRTQESKGYFDPDKPINSDGTPRYDHFRTEV